MTEGNHILNATTTNRIQRMATEETRDNLLTSKLFNRAENIRIESTKAKYVFELCRNIFSCIFFRI